MKKTNHLILLSLSTLLMVASSSCATAYQQTADAEDTGNSTSSLNAYPNANQRWGQLANFPADPFHKGVYFFAGNMVSGDDQAIFSMHSPNPSVDYNWYSADNSGLVLGQIAATHANVINAPYFGHNNCGNRFSDVQDSTYLQLMLRAQAAGLLFMPVFESSDNCSAPVSPNTSFTDLDCQNRAGCKVYHPAIDLNTQTLDPATALPQWGYETAQRTIFLITSSRQLNASGSWARVVGRDGASRIAINLLHAGGSDVPTAAFVNRLNSMAAYIEAQIKPDLIGFTLDTWCDNEFPSTQCLDPDPTKSGNSLASSNYVLAIQNFTTENQLGGTTTLETDANVAGSASRLILADSDPVGFAAKANFKKSTLQQWSASLPTYVDASPGYVVPPYFQPCGTCSDPHNCARSIEFGDTGDEWQISSPPQCTATRTSAPAVTRPEWRNFEAELGGDTVNPNGHSILGFTADAWNKYEEVGAFADTISPVSGATDVKRRWLTDLYSNDPATCNVVHYARTGFDVRVFGGICSKYLQTGGYFGSLGEAWTNEGGISVGGADNSTGSNPNCATNCGSVRRQDFAHGTVYFDNNGGHEIHGLIHDKFVVLGSESGYGLPYTDETDTANGTGANSHFYNGGMIYWKRGAAQAFEVHGQIGALWAAMGWELSVTGFPTSDEIPLTYYNFRTGKSENGRENRFEHGAIVWSATLPAHQRGSSYTTAWYCPSGTYDANCY